MCTKLAIYCLNNQSIKNIFSFCSLLSAPVFSPLCSPLSPLCCDQCINLYLEVCHAALAVSPLSDLLSWTSAAHIAARKHHSSAVTLWLMRGTALLCADMHSQLLARASSEMHCREADSHTDIDGSDGYEAALLQAWKDNTIADTALYTFPTQISETPYTFYELFARYFSGVERFLSAGNRSALYGSLGDVLVRYYQLYASMCSRRYRKLRAIAAASLGVEGVGGSGYDSVESKEITRGSAASEGTSASVVMESGIVIPMLSHLPGSGGGGGGGGGMGSAVRTEVEASTAPRGVIPPPDLLTCSCGETAGPPGSASASGTAVSVTMTVAGISAASGIDVLPPTASSPGSSSSSTGSSSTGGSSTGGSSSTGCSSTGGSSSSGVSIESVLGWCRRQAAWQPAPRASTTLRAALSASLTTTEPPPAQPQHWTAPDQTRPD
jgi:hypothetical protein